MATFWLNSSGSNTAPYDTKAKGAHTIDVLMANVTLVLGDIIIFTKNNTNFETIYDNYQNGLNWFLSIDTPATTVYKVGYYYPNLGQIPSVIE